MSYEQLHFAFGASIPFIIGLFFYNKKFIFLTPLLMSIAGIFAALPSYLNWNGVWTNIFFFYGVIHNVFSRGQFVGYGLTVIMFTIIISLQAYYLWRCKCA